MVLSAVGRYCLEVEALGQQLLMVQVTLYHYTPDIRSMWGYIVFAFPFRPFVHTNVRSSFCHKVKVFALKFIRPYILKTL